MTHPTATPCSVIDGRAARVGETDFAAVLLSLALLGGGWTAGCSAEGTQLAPAEGASVLERFRAKPVFARKQPADAYIGSRYK